MKAFSQKQVLHRSKGVEGFPILLEIYKLLLFPHFLQFSISDSGGGRDSSMRSLGGSMPSPRGIGSGVSCVYFLVTLQLFVSIHNNEQDKYLSRT